MDEEDLPTALPDAQSTATCPTCRLLTLMTSNIRLQAREVSSLLRRGLSKEEIRTGQ